MTDRNTDRRASSDLLEAFDSSTRSASAACHSGSQMQDAVDTLKAEVSLGRFGQPVRLAPVYVFLASREVRYVTGEVHGATGGNGSA